MNFHFILVEPAIPENIGSAARAMKTMGYEELILVNTSAHQEKKAFVLAHGSRNVLENAVHYNTLKEAVDQLDFIVATSAKKRRISKENSKVANLYDFLLKKKSSIRNVGIVFGREERGLSNDELKLADHIIQIPMSGKYPSLNLSQAVMIVSYELYNKSRKSKRIPARKTTTEDLSFKNLQGRVKNILHQINITNDTMVGRIMERFNLIADEDIRLFHSVCTRLEEFLKMKKR